MSIYSIKNIPPNVFVRNGNPGLNFPTKLGSFLPTITQQPFPLARNINPEDTVTLAVVAEGSQPLQYQWYREDEAIQDTGTALTPILSVTEFNPLSAGKYYVKVSNVLGVAYSNTVTVSANRPVGFTTGLQNLTAYFENIPTDVVTLSVATSGTSPITYTWTKGGAVIQGETKSIYAPSFVLSDDNTTFSISAKNGAGPVVSSESVLTVKEALLGFVSYAAPITANPGMSAIFTMQVSGKRPIEYIWRKDKTDTTEVPLLSTSNKYISLSFVNITQESEAQYDLIISNLSGASNKVSLTSISVALSVNKPIAFTIPPPILIPVGGNATATLSAEVSGTKPYSFQWYKDDGTPITDNSPTVVGAQTSALTLTEMVDGTDTGLYFVVASNIVNSVTSTTVELFSATAPRIIDSPGEQTINPGGTFRLSVNATPSRGLNYQWYQNNQELSGETNSQYEVFNATEENEGYYEVVVSNTISPAATSNSVFVNVRNPVNYISTNLTSLTTNPGTDATFEIRVSSNGISTPPEFPITYKWHFNGNLLPDGTHTMHLSVDTYTFNTVAEENEGRIYVEVFNGVGTGVVSNTVSLSVNDPVGFTTDLILENYTQAYTASGDEVTLSVFVTGTEPYQYRWYKDSGQIPEENSSSLAIDSGRPLSTTDFGTYFVKVSNVVQEVTSTYVKVSGSVPLILIEVPQDLSFNPGNNTTFTVVACGGDANYSYQWYKDDILQPDKTTPNYPITNAQESDQAVYTVSVSSYHHNSETPYISSVSARLSVFDPAGFATAMPDRISAWEDTDTVTLTAFASGETPLYFKWYKNDTEIPTATLSTYTVNGNGPLSTTDFGTFYVTVSNFVVDVPTQSNTFKLSGSVPLKIIQDIQSVSAVPGSSNTFTVAASGGSGYYTYRWIKNDITVDEQSSPSYTIENLAESDEAVYKVEVSSVRSPLATVARLTSTATLSVLDPAGLIPPTLDPPEQYENTNWTYEQ